MADYQESLISHLYAYALDLVDDLDYEVKIQDAGLEPLKQLLILIIIIAEHYWYVRGLEEAAPSWHLGNDSQYLYFDWRNLHVVLLVQDLPENLKKIWAQN